MFHRNKNGKKLLFLLHLSKELSQAIEVSWNLEIAWECRCRWVSFEVPRAGAVGRWGETCKSNRGTPVFNPVIHYHPEFSSKFRKTAWGTEQL